AQIQQASINLSKLDQQKNQLSQEIESAKQDLAAFQSQSREKIADWMFQKFNNQTITTKPIQTPSQTIQDVQTLFGVYTIVSPRKLEPSQKSETTVRFTPAVFTQSLFPVSIKTGPLATSVPIPVGLEFKPGKVLGAFGARNFNLSENDFVDVDTRSPITWNWESNATNQFAGARFEIQMQARSDKPADSQKTALDLPVTIEHDPGKPFLERFQALIGTGIGAVWSLFVALVSVTLSVYFTHKFALHREALNREALNRPKPPDPPKIHIR
ncbi:MAG TPA: hypothetical protein VFT74_06180, partial [Isosphaeraceae bacterium]|nr:hypothetical protein [Isosphaeraceae bacterium]